MRDWEIPSGEDVPRSPRSPASSERRHHQACSSSSLLLLSLELSDTTISEPQIRALLGTAAHLCYAVALKLRTATLGTAQACAIHPFRVWGFGCREGVQRFRVLGGCIEVSGVGRVYRGFGYREGV